MMSVGRPPVATAIKIARGNPGKRALNHREPQPKAVEPKRPDNLSERAIREWESLVPILASMRVLTEADGVALGILCQNIAELEQVMKARSESGYLTENPTTGSIHVNPLVRVQADLDRRVCDGLREFGLTPASRSRIVTTSAVAAENPFARLQRQAEERKRKQQEQAQDLVQ